MAEDVIARWRKSLAAKGALMAQRNEIVLRCHSHAAQLESIDTGQMACPTPDCPVRIDVTVEVSE